MKYYPKRHSKNNAIEPKIYLKSTSFEISSRGPILWNSLTDKGVKTNALTTLFKRKLNNHLIKIKIIANYFTICRNII